MSDTDSEGDNYVTFGTPLEPYEEDEIPTKRKYQDPNEQIAVDADGKRRFHGAFTGGFTVGYGNSVSTPEGFTPAQFKSSRKEKAEATTSKPEDFMDEEDRGEFGIAPRRLQTRAEFGGNKMAPAKRYHDGVIPGEPILEELLKPVQEVAAVRILKSMGIRIAKKAKERCVDKVYGCYVPPEFRQDRNGDDSDSEVDYDALYSIDEVNLPTAIQKNDRFGIGYQGLSRHSVLGVRSSTSHLKMVDKGKKVSIHGQAFGVGALEEEDEDIYATHDMSQYDFALGPSNVKDTAKKQSEKGCLSGFVRAKRPPLSFNKYPPPDVPRDYVPKLVRRSRFDSSNNANERNRALGRHDLTPETRGVILGEISHSEAAEKDKTGVDPVAVDERLAAIVGRSVDFVTNAPESEISDPSLPTDQGGEFKPFASDPAKQVRYVRFLKDKSTFESNSQVASEKDSLLEWERAREKTEFEQASRLYRPLEGVMNERFTHGSQTDDATNPLKAVERYRSSMSNEDSIAAAAEGMYGKLTRTVVEWVPSPLLCKRFNVAVRSDYVYKDDTTKPKRNFSIFESLEQSIHDKDSYARDQDQFSGSRSMEGKRKLTLPPPKKEETPQVVAKKRLTVADLFLIEREKELAGIESAKPDNSTEVVSQTIEKFDKMDLYKAIFLSDSEDSDVGAESDGPSVDKPPANVDRNDSPPRGIFANIDFDELNAWKRGGETDKGQGGAVERDKETKPDVQESLPDTYGPKLPQITTLCSSTQSKEDKIESLSSDSSEDWVETSKVKSKKSKKKKSKHKKSKKKHKHKEKK